MPTETSTRQLDPTRTVTLRKRFSSAYAALFARLACEAQQIAERILAMTWYSSAQQAELFDREFRRTLDREAAKIENDEREGLAALILLAYLRGLRQADADASKLQIPVYDEPQQAVMQPRHTEETALLIVGLRSRWRGMLDATATVAVAEMASALASGRRPNFREMRRQAGISARAFAMTGIVGVFNAALLARYQELGVQRVGAEVEAVQMQTALNPCRRCARLASIDNGQGRGVYTITQARGVLPVHPYCRCRWRAVR